MRVLFFVIRILAICLFIINCHKDDSEYYASKPIGEKILYVICSFFDYTDSLLHAPPASVTNYFEPLKGDFIYSTIEEEEMFEIKESEERDRVDFELYKHERDRGFYEYYFWVDAIDTGTVYLKGIHIGKIWNEHLRDLGTSTEMEIYNQSDGFVKCGPKFFVIYQNFNVDSYLARFELWYKPKNVGKERLLATKIYKVSGTRPKFF